jgi:prevent-host-death family protein
MSASTVSGRLFGGAAAVPKVIIRRDIIATSLWDIPVMPNLGEHSVSLRELRQHTSEVLARVRHGETVDVTEYGKLVARIVPVLDRLVDAGRVRSAVRPGTGRGCGLLPLVRGVLEAHGIRAPGVG